jgi:hypothetical protein
MTRAPLDNNATERGLVVGRKNHYGSRSKCGTEVDALFCSLIESAKVLRRRAQGVSAAGRAWALASRGTVTLPPTAARLTPPPPMSLHRRGGFRVVARFAITRAETAVIAPVSEWLR